MRKRKNKIKFQTEWNSRHKFIPRIWKLIPQIKHIKDTQSGVGWWHGERDVNTEQFPLDILLERILDVAVRVERDQHHEEDPEEEEKEAG